jgi:hypothetical protein
MSGDRQGKHEPLARLLYSRLRHRCGTTPASADGPSPSVTEERGDGFRVAAEWEPVVGMLIGWPFELPKGLLTFGDVQSLLPDKQRQRLCGDRAFSRPILDGALWQPAGGGVVSSAELPDMAVPAPDLAS